MYNSTPTSLWRRVSNGGIGWRAGDASSKVNDSGIVVICFDIEFQDTRYHYIAEEARYSGGTEHNDMCLSFSGGLVLVKNGRARRPSRIRSSSGFTKTVEEELSICPRWIRNRIASQPKG